MTNYVVLDTNILLNNGNPFSRFSKTNIIIPLTCIIELDNQKTREGDIGFKARRVIRLLFKIKDSKNFNDWILVGDNLIKVENNIDDCLSLDYDCKDDDIIGTLSYCNEVYGKTILVTNDLSMAIKTEALGFETRQLEENNNLNSDFKGVKTIYIDATNEELVSRHFTKKEDNVFNLHPNEYLIIYEVGNDKPKEIERWTGKKFERLNYKSFPCKPKNDLQACAMDLLSRREIPIKIIVGTYGSGKTYLTTQYIVKALQDETFTKWVECRQAEGDMDSSSVGFLKGTYEEKTDMFFKPIFDNLEGGEFMMQSWKQLGKIEFLIPYYAKGRSFNGDVFLHVDEAEDLTLKTLKMLGSRIGENTKGQSGCVVFTGDINQTESRYLKENGLATLIEKTKNNPLIGFIYLEDDVRSEASKVFADL